jgi:xanthine dehydrogenase accessory factor
MNMQSIFQTLGEIEKKQESAALCTVVRTSGSTPRHSASKMLVFSDGRILGSVGGGELENRVIQGALEVLKDGKARLLEYKLADPAQGDVGVCGGSVEVFVEPILPKSTLAVIGGGHVGKAVAHLAKWLGFHVVVSDDRPEFCTPEANPDADEFFNIPMAEIPRHMNITSQTFLVLTTRGSSVDVEGLPALLETPAAYVGVIGSRKRWLTTSRELLDKGISKDTLSRVHAPMGMGIGAETPEEIAVSILAEVLMVHGKGSGTPMKELRVHSSGKEPV